MPVETLNFLFSLGAIALQLCIAGVLVAYFMRRKSAFAAKVWDFTGERGILIVLLLTLAGTLGSLYYSVIVGYGPCSLCWYQRVFMYPQVIIAALALWFSDARASARYLLALSIVGGLVSLYHYYGQTWNNSALTCLGNGVSCAQRHFVEFGYVTMPLLALTLFVAAGIAAVAVIKRNK